MDSVELQKVDSGGSMVLEVDSSRNSNKKDKSHLIIKIYFLLVLTLILSKSIKKWPHKLKIERRKTIFGLSSSIEERIFRVTKFNR